MLSKGNADKVCSAKQCDTQAVYALEWSNPRIHTNRSKIWLCCEDHKDFLTEYIALRSFPYELKSVDELE